MGEMRQKVFPALLEGQHGALQKQPHTVSGLAPVSEAGATKWVFHFERSCSALVIRQVGFKNHLKIFKEHRKLQLWVAFPAQGPKKFLLTRGPMYLLCPDVHGQSPLRPPGGPGHAFTRILPWASRACSHCSNGLKLATATRCSMPYWLLSSGAKRSSMGAPCIALEGRGQPSGGFG